VSANDKVKITVDPSGDWRVTNTSSGELGVSIMDGERRCRALLAAGETRTFTGLTRRAELEVLEDVSSFRGQLKLIGGEPC
jgi:hypothetical protein